MPSLKQVRICATAAMSMIVLWGSRGATQTADALPQALASLPAWTEFRDAVRSESSSLRARILAHDAQCSDVPKDQTARANQCVQAKAELEAASAAYEAHLEAYRRTLAWYRGAPTLSQTELSPAAQQAFAALESLAAGEHWPAEKRARFAAALRSLLLADDGVVLVKDDRLEWEQIRDRTVPEGLRRAADAAAAAPLFSASAGRQHGAQDCAVFALANASARPYGMIAAAAAEAIQFDPLRKAAARRDPQAVLGNSGLNGGELVYLTERFGEVSIARPQDFPKTLAAGSPIMVDVGEHEVVLTKAFDYDGKTWFEAVDSTADTTHRVYLTAPELNAKLSENGIVYHPEPGQTVPLLR